MVPVTRLVLHCPDIRTQSDGMAVEQMLLGAPGVGETSVDWRTGIVDVVTANQDAGIDVRDRLRKAGFPAEDVS